MKNWVWTSGLALSLSLMLCMFSGCKKTDDGGTDGGSSAASHVRPAAAGEVSNWPSVIPKLADGTLLRTSDKDGVFRGAMYTEIKNPQTAFEQYKKTLEEKGWTLDEDRSNETNFIGEFTRGQADLHVSISKDGSLANLFYSAD